jgi:hypothetical protein
MFFCLCSAGNYEPKTKTFDFEDGKGSFYFEYISKFYPKAYAIRQKFLAMTPEHVAAALNDIVCVFVKEPWFYFQDTPSGFKLSHYWEYVLDQCGILHHFLGRAKVDLKTNKISFGDDFVSGDYCFWETWGEVQPKKQNLLDYLRKNFLGVYTDFYALSFDYAVKFFNEGILLKDIKQANRFFNEIESIFEKLRDTPREFDYYESIKICKELLGILKHKLGVKPEFDDLGGMQAGLSKEIAELIDVI